MELAAIVIALFGASEVSVAVLPGSICIDRARLTSRLTALNLQVVDGTSQRLAVTIRPTPEGVRVFGARAGAAFERTVPAEVDACAAVERVVTALIASWSLQLPSPEVAETRAPQPAARAPQRVRPVIEVPEKHEPAVEAAPPVVAAEVVSTPAPTPTPDPAPIRVVFSALPRVALPEPSDSAPEPPSAWPLSLDFAALVGGSYGPTSDLTAVGQLHAALSFGRLGLLLEGGFQSARSAEQNAIRIESTMQWLSLSGRTHFNPHPRLRLDLAVGFRVWRIAAQSINAATPKSLDLAAFGWVASAGASFRIFGPVALQLRAFGSLRNNHPRFVIDGAGPTLDLQPWEGGLILGLEFRVFGGA